MPFWFWNDDLKDDELVRQIADFQAHGSEAKAKAAGRYRLEGKEYVVADGDIINFRFNV